MSVLTTIDGIPVYSTIEEALAWAKKNKLEGAHAHRSNNTLGYMGGRPADMGSGLMPSTQLPIEKQLNAIFALQVQFPYPTNKEKPWWKCRNCPDSDKNGACLSGKHRKFPICLGFGMPEEKRRSVEDGWTYVDPEQLKEVQSWPNWGITSDVDNINATTTTATIPTNGGDSDGY